MLACRLKDSVDALQVMAFGDLTGRVAALLLWLADSESGVVKGYSHQDLGLMVGCLRESITVVVDRFKRNQAVAVGRRRIEITDRPYLERVVDQR